MMRRQSCLVIAAHPDDEILGCGATAARLDSEGCRVSALILSAGVTSRGGDEADNRKRIIRLRKETMKAASAVGISRIFTADFPDNAFDTVALLHIVKHIEKVTSEVKPSIVFTHYADDLNIDHRITFMASITACRPVGHQAVAEMYSYEVLSSTGWKYPLTFSPDLFFDVSATFGRKVKALRAYGSELMAPPHPRSVEGITAAARYWGMNAGTGYAEAFKTIRVVR